MSGELDIALLIGRPVEPSFTYHELTWISYRVAGPAAWKDRIEAADWSALAALPWLTPSSSSAYSTMLAGMFGSRGLELNSVVRFDNSSVGRSIMKAGGGMLLLREEHAIEGERAGYLAISPLAAPAVTLLIAHQSARNDDPLIRAFLHAARQPWPQMKPTHIGDERTAPPDVPSAHDPDPQLPQARRRCPT